MEPEYEILKTWNLSVGLTATIKFASKLRPEIGTTIVYNGQGYQIKGYIAHTSPLEATIKLYERMQEGIYDCLLEPLTRT